VQQEGEPMVQMMRRYEAQMAEIDKCDTPPTAGIRFESNEKVRVEDGSVVVHLASASV
ncbi:MAG: hypothetical protein Q9204_005731, partial [Flavoplaca sp. TL-2023a]